MTREQAKEILRNAPTIESTFADIDREFRGVEVNYLALKKRHEELSGQLTQVAAARAELESTGEPSSAAKPKTKGK